MSFKRIIVTVLVIILVVFVIIRIGVFVSGKSEKNIVPKSPQLETVVKQIISSHLLSPGSAQFAELIIKKNIIKENQYVAFGDVDSQNGFGALLRSHFFIVIVDKGGDKQSADNWTIDSLDLGDSILISDGKLNDIPLSISDLSEESRAAQKQIEDIYRGQK